MRLLPAMIAMKSMIVALAVLAAVANAGSVDIKVDHDNKITITPREGLEDTWQQLVAPLSEVDNVGDPPPAFCKIPVNGPGSASECEESKGFRICIQDPRCVSSAINGLKVCDTQCCMKEEDVRPFCGAWDHNTVPTCLGVVCGNWKGKSLQGWAIGTYGKYKTSYCLARHNMNGPSSTTGAYGWKRCSSDAKALAPVASQAPISTPVSSLPTVAASGQGSPCKGSTTPFCDGKPPLWPPHNCTTSSQLPPGDCKAWVDLWDNMDAQHWGWGHDGCNDEKYRLDPCACQYSNDEFSGGVFCQNSRITQILLSGNNLKGSLQPSLTKLTALKGLFLQQNDISGTIPAFNFEQIRPGACKWNGGGAYQRCCDLGGLNFSCPLPAGAAEHCGASCK